MNADNQAVYNALVGTLHLIEQAQEWERVAADESLLPGVREFAAQRAQAIRQELSS